MSPQLQEHVLVALRARIQDIVDLEKEPSPEPEEVAPKSIDDEAEYLAELLEEQSRWVSGSSGSTVACTVSSAAREDRTALSKDLLASFPDTSSDTDKDMSMNQLAVAK